MRAFVLAAGLGTRLRPLTADLPKPLVPVGRKPLITFAFDHLIADLGIEEIIVNTHHCAAAYAGVFPDAAYRGRPLRFRYEPTLLDTGGGLRNVADLLDPAETFAVYNGDILTDLPLQPLLAAHRASGNQVTLVLRSRDGARHVAWDPARGQVRDIRHLLGSSWPSAYSFASVYLVEPAFLERIPARSVVSVIPSFLDLIRAGNDGLLGGVLVDDGQWYDLGTREDYLRAHRQLWEERPPRFPRYGAPDPGWRQWVDPAAQVAPDAELLGATVVGAGAQVGPGARLQDTLVGPGAEIASHSRLDRCIVRAQRRVAGTAVDAVY